MLKQIERRESRQTPKEGAGTTPRLHDSVLQAGGLLAPSAVILLLLSLLHVSGCSRLAVSSSPSSASLGCGGRAPWDSQVAETDHAAPKEGMTEQRDRGALPSVCALPYPAAGSVTAGWQLSAGLWLLLPCWYSLPVPRLHPPQYNFPHHCYTF